jgi:hypothetical protein
LSLRIKSTAALRDQVEQSDQLVRERVEKLTRLEKRLG